MYMKPFIHSFMHFPNNLWIWGLHTVHSLGFLCRPVSDAILFPILHSTCTYRKAVTAELYCWRFTGEDALRGAPAAREDMCLRGLECQASGFLAPATCFNWAKIAWNVEILQGVMRKEEKAYAFRKLSLTGRKSVKAPCRGRRESNLQMIQDVFVENFMLLEPAAQAPWPVGRCPQWPVNAASRSSVHACPWPQGSGLPSLMHCSPGGGWERCTLAFAVFPPPFTLAQLNRKKYIKNGVVWEDGRPIVYLTKKKIKVWANMIIMIFDYLVSVLRRLWVVCIIRYLKLWVFGVWYFNYFVFYFM